MSFAHHSDVETLSTASALFSRKTCFTRKREQHKELHTPINRETVTLKDLIRCNPVYNPPPSFRQSRTSKSALPCSSPTTEAQCTTEAIREEEVDMFILNEDGDVVLNEAYKQPSYADQIDNIDYSKVIKGERGMATYASFREKTAKTSWTVEDMNLFYHALCSVGQDFAMIAVIMKKTRKQVRDKYGKEQRENPHLIHMALTNPKRLNLSIFHRDELLDNDQNNKAAAAASAACNDSSSAESTKSHVKRRRCARKRKAAAVVASIQDEIDQLNAAPQPQKKIIDDLLSES